MTQQHPITPPPELVQQWRKSGPADAAVNNAYERHIATCAAQWGADQELEACCEEMKSIPSPLGIPFGKMASNALRAARRPKPPSLKEQALAALSEADQGLNKFEWQQRSNTIRRALEQLDD
jgi:hypothetical protein